MFERGKIRNESIAKILRDFTGMRFERGITPTDIDAFVEFDDKVYIIVETKFGDTRVHGGQRLALERLVDRLGETRHALLVIAKHNVEPDTGMTIDVGNCIVTEYRSRGTWRVPQHDQTVRSIVEQFRDWASREFET